MTYAGSFIWSRAEACSPLAGLLSVVLSLVFVCFLSLSSVDWALSICYPAYPTRLSELTKSDVTALGVRLLIEVWCRRRTAIGLRSLSLRRRRYCPKIGISDSDLSADHLDRFYSSLDLLAFVLGCPVVLSGSHFGSAMEVSPPASPSGSFSEDPNTSFNQTLRHLSTDDVDSLSGQQDSRTEFIRTQVQKRF